MSQSSNGFVEVAVCLQVSSQIASIVFTFEKHQIYHFKAKDNTILIYPDPTCECGAYTVQIVKHLQKQTETLNLIPDIDKKNFLKMGLYSIISYNMVTG